MPNSYYYMISLRLTHPSIDPSVFSQTLGLEPQTTWHAGKSRKTPKGTPLEGTYQESFWTCQITEDKWPDKELVEALLEILDQLEPHKEFFHRLVSEGGNAEFFIGWFFDGNSGDVFDQKILARLVDLKINLSFDIYPPTEDPV